MAFRLIEYRSEKILIKDFDLQVCEFGEARQFKDRMKKFVLRSKDSREKREEMNLSSLVSVIYPRIENETLCVI